MARFASIFKETGVDPANQFMVVGLRGLNLVALHDAKGFDVRDLRYDTKTLEIREVTRDQVHRVSSALSEQFISWNLQDEESAKSYWGVMHTALGTLNSRLLAVTGKARGSTEIKGVHGRTILRMEVAVVPQTSFTVAFKFLQHLDESNTMKSVTQWEPSDARWLINKLNWIYGPQANITFEMTGADWVKVNQVLGEPLNDKAFLNYVVQEKNDSADLNIFFVGRWKGGEAGGTYFSDKQVAVVEGNPKSLPVTRTPIPFSSTWRTRWRISCSESGTWTSTIPTGRISCYPWEFRVVRWTSSWFCK